MAETFSEGDEVTSPHFEGVGTVESVSDDEIGTVYVRLPEDSGLITNRGVAGFPPESLRRA